MQASGQLGFAVMGDLRALREPQDHFQDQHLRKTDSMQGIVGRHREMDEVDDPLGRRGRRSGGIV